MSCEKEVIYDYDQEHYTAANFQSCEIEQCPDLSIDFFRLQEPSVLANVVNDKVQLFLESNLSSGATQEKELIPMIENYLNDAQTAYPEDSVFSGTHEIIIDIAVTYQSNELFSMIEYAYKFDGGAHGFERLQYSNFDPRTGQVLNNKDCIQDAEGFLAFAKAEFQKKYPNASVSFEDYFKFQKANIGYSQEGLVIYEKMPVELFDLPEIELTLPWEEVRDFLSF